MKRVLVTYVSMAGSTAEVADIIAEEITKNNIQVDVLLLKQVNHLENYDAVVIGAPMIMGWHRAALHFLKQNRKVLQDKPVAIFVLAMSLTQENDSQRFGDIPVFVDEKLPKPPKRADRLSFRERYATLSNYLHPILRAIHPASIGVFGGRLEYGRLKWWAVLFAMLIIKARAGDRRDWDAIRSWAAALPMTLQVTESHNQQVPEFSA